MAPAILSVGPHAIVVDGDPETVAALAPLGVRAGEATNVLATLRVRRGRPAEALDGYRASFFHGQVRGATRSSGEVLVIDDHASIAVSPDGTVLDACILESGLDPRSVTVRTTLFVACAVALARRGLFHVHGALGRDVDGSGVLVIGESGAGKSTTIAALMHAGVEPMSDDATFVDAAGIAYGFRKPFHLEPAALERLPSLSTLLWRSVGDRGRVEALPPGLFAGGVRVERIVVLDRSGGERPLDTTAQPLDGAETFGAILESSTLAVVDELLTTRSHLDALHALVSASCAARVRAGRDLLVAPERSWQRLADVCGWPADQKMRSGT